MKAEIREGGALCCWAGKAPRCVGIQYYIRARKENAKIEASCQDRFCVLKCKRNVVPLERNERDSRSAMIDRLIFPIDGIKRHQHDRRSSRPCWCALFIRTTKEIRSKDRDLRRQLPIFISYPRPVTCQTASLAERLHGQPSSRAWLSFGETTTLKEVRCAVPEFGRLDFVGSHASTFSAWQPFGDLAPPEEPMKMTW
jgi:hypothetical protein